MHRRGRLILRARERIMHQALYVVRLSGIPFAEWLNARQVNRIQQFGGSVEKF